MRVGTHDELWRRAVKTRVLSGVVLEGIALAIVGSERPGIVRDVTQALTRLGVNIEEFSSGVEGEPFTGAEMFRANLSIRLPDGLAVEELRKTLERLAAEIMVDLSVGEGEPVG